MVPLPEGEAIYSKMVQTLYVRHQAQFNPSALSLKGQKHAMRSSSPQKETSLPIETSFRLRGPQSGAGDGVGGEVLVEVEENTGVLSGVERCSGDTAGGGGAGASDHEVDALGVELSAVGLSTGVEGDDLVAENVVARSKARGDVDGPGVALELS